MFPPLPAAFNKHSPPSEKGAVSSLISALSLHIGRSKSQDLTGWWAFVVARNLSQLTTGRLTVRSKFGGERDGAFSNPTGNTKIREM